MVPAIVQCVFAVTQSVTESAGPSAYSTRTVYAMRTAEGTQRLALTHGQYIFGLQPGELAYVCGAPGRADRFVISFSKRGTQFGPDVDCDLGTASSVERTEAGDSVTFSTRRGERTIATGDGRTPLLGERGWVCSSKYRSFYSPANAESLARGVIGPFTATH